MKQIQKRLTYANVMSSISVFLVLGGATAFAASKIGSNQLKGNAVTTGKIKKEAVTASKVKNNAIIASKIADNAVTTNKIADDAVTGAKVKESTLGQVPSANVANSATTAASATSSNPTAFAKVNGDGTVNDALSKGLTGANVTHPNTGVYCVTVPAFVPRGGQVTPQFGGTSGTTANITIGGTGNCPAPAVQVLTFTTGAAPASADLTFYVELYH